MTINRFLISSVSNYFLVFFDSVRPSGLIGIARGRKHSRLCCSWIYSGTFLHTYAQHPGTICFQMTLFTKSLFSLCFFLYSCTEFSYIGKLINIFYGCCNENPIYVFLFWELRSLNPNFHIHVSGGDLYIPRIGLSVRDLYIPGIGPHIFLQQCRQINRSLSGIFVSNFRYCLFAVCEWVTKSLYFF